MIYEFFSNKNNFIDRQKVIKLLEILWLEIKKTEILNVHNQQMIVYILFNK